MLRGAVAARTVHREHTQQQPPGHSQLVLLHERLAGGQGLGQRATAASPDHHQLPGSACPAGQGCQAAHSNSGVSAGRRSLWRGDWTGWRSSRCAITAGQPARGMGFLGRGAARVAERGSRRRRQQARWRGPRAQAPGQWQSVSTFTAPAALYNQLDSLRGPVDLWCHRRPTPRLRPSGGCWPSALMNGYHVHARRPTAWRHRTTMQRQSSCSVGAAAGLHKCRPVKVPG